jgi:valyl-tRNA synthetase
MSYPFKDIESKWQKRWEETKEYRTENDFSKKKFYGLIEFPYPSGNGLHVGHPRSYVALDVIARKRRMEGTMSYTLSALMPSDCRQKTTRLKQVYTLQSAPMKISTISADS